MLKSVLIHLSRNMWSDQPGTFTDYLVFDEKIWQDLLRRCAETGINAIFLDVGDGIEFKSHPEIVTSGAWSAAKLKEEIKRCNDLGITLYPKLNFSTAHDAWLKEYGRMVSTPVYYQVCRDLIAETMELFQAPEFFHIGMDEENAFNQVSYSHAVIRQGNLWWSDLNFYCDEVRKNGARPWMWSDKLWTCDADEFVCNVPKDVVQNNWYYWNEVTFSEDIKQQPLPAREDFSIPEWRWKIIDSYHKLEAFGYDQVPCGSNWATPENYEILTGYCKTHLAPEKWLGMMMAPWTSTEEKNHHKWITALDQVKAAHQKYNIF